MPTATATTPQRRRAHAGAPAVAEQLSLDPGREARLVMEKAADRVRAKFGPEVIGPAGAALRAS
ncbi:hypothetical protein [Streptomyces sp. NPDC093544]|uniref:hypothetical protein n=1 Tax=Streptomyces sp. NPDC093544 TaxID=3155200 RepID=UPI0034237FCB